MNRKTLIFTLVSGLFVTASIQAADTLLTFEDMDGNANGYISMGEAVASKDIASHFKNIDKNGDGNINITSIRSIWAAGA
jgi:Ca2+-binding EF-hand superfamily protein